MDTLAVRLIVPLAGSIVDFHHQVIRPPPCVSEQHQLRRYAPYLAHHKENRKIAIVMHQGSGLIGLTNEEFKARHDGKDNPNIDLIKQLHAAGVTFHLSGQGVLSRNVKEEDLLDEIQVDYWALTTLIELGRQGYVKIGG